MTDASQKIPDGWNVKKLGEMGKFVSGGTPDTEKPEYWNGDIIWLTPSEITKLPTRFVSDSERKITRAGLKNSSAVLLPVGSLIICTRATVGDCCINIKEVSTNQGFKNLIPENSNIDFLYYLISSHKTDLIRKACGSTFLEISKHDIERLEYSVPPLAEQEKIAEILGTWDSAIEKLTTLIAAKRLQKKGLMQKLLTAQIRLPGFTGEWEKVKLGNACTTFSGGTPSKSEKEYWAKKDIKWISAKYIDDDKITGYDFISQKGFENSTAKLALKGDIILVTRVSVGKIVICKETFAVNQDMTVIRPNDASICYIYNTLKMKIAEIIDKSQGLAIKGITKQTLNGVTLKLPPLSEQKAIADILSKADEEIDLLTRKLDLIQSQKKGLMQQLLTGKIRVKVA